MAIIKVLHASITASVLRILPGDFTEKMLEEDKKDLRKSLIDYIDEKGVKEAKVVYKIKEHDGSKGDFNMLEQPYGEEAMLVLKDYYEWCAAQGIAKNTVITFAKERGILIS